MGAPEQTFSFFPHVPPPLNVQLTVLAERPCAYLPGRMTTLRAFAVGEISPRLFQQFMDAGYRRSGVMIYQPICVGCRQCQPIRVPVEAFRPNKSQRRTRRRNADVVTTVGEPVPDQERFALYAAYQTRWHRDDQAPDYDDFAAFLYSSPTHTLEFTHRVGGRLIAVGICDVTPQGLSSVYFYFDPDEARRALGVFGALAEIDFARSAALPYYFLGYWVRDCPTMHYKADYGPAEILCLDGTWRRADDASTPAG